MYLARLRLAPGFGGRASVESASRATYPWFVEAILAAPPRHRHETLVSWGGRARRLAWIGPREGPAARRRRRDPLASRAGLLYHRSPALSSMSPDPRAPTRWPEARASRGMVASPH